MSSPVQLAYDAIMDQRPFTHPQHTAGDAAVLREMLHRVNALLDASPIPWAHTHEAHTQQAAPATQYAIHNNQYHTGDDGRKQRWILTQPDRLRALRPITVVGFFGQRKPGADHAAVRQVDDTLIGEFGEHEGLLCYGSRQLQCGNFANLVLFTSPAAKNHWGSSKAHAYAAATLSPNYYASVRLYNGHLPAGLAAPERLRMDSVKYYDYQSRPFWRGIRDLHPTWRAHDDPHTP